MNIIKQIYKIFLKEYGPQGWWPLSKGHAETRHYRGEPENNKDRFEIITGSILTQNTAWTNVEKAIFNLNKKKLLNRASFLKIHESKLAEFIKPSGYYNQKAIKLKTVSKFFSDKAISPSASEIV